MSKRRDPVLLGEILARAEATSARAAGSALAPAVWRDVVGERIARRTRPGALERGALTIHVASSVWAQELSLFSTTLLERLAQRGVHVARLRFRVEAVDASPRFPKPAPSRTPLARDLPPKLRERLDRIEDAELRAAIAEAARLILPANREPRRRKRRP